MSEKAPINNPDYLEHHPNAIQDVEKAQTMAEAGKGSHDLVLGQQEVSKKLDDWYNRGLGAHAILGELYQAKELEKKVEDESRLRGIFRKTLDEHSNRYGAALKNTRISEDAGMLAIEQGDAKKGLKASREKEEEYKRWADRNENEAGRQYDEKSRTLEDVGSK